MTDDALRLPAELRERLLSDFQPTRRLPSPWRRALLVLPVALIAVTAAPLVFEVRGDSDRLGWVGMWGVSAAQFVVGFVMVIAALRESVPGRGWSMSGLITWLAVPVVAVTAVTLLSWEGSPILVRGRWWVIAGMCFAGSASTALPVVALSSILASRAYPTRPAIAGALLGAGAGLIADAGWRVFCHFSEPAHVLSAHLAAVAISAVMGSLTAVRMSTPGTRAR